MATLTVEVTAKRKHKAEVTLPLYRKHIVDHDAHPSTFIYMRVDEVPRGDTRVLREVTVTLRNEWGNVTREAEIRITAPYVFDGSEPNYTLGQGEFTSSEEDFTKALIEAEFLLAEARARVR